MAATGKIVQVLGNVVDVEFTPETLPNINDALRVGVNEDSRAAADTASSDGASSGSCHSGGSERTMARTLAKTMLALTTAGSKRIRTLPVSALSSALRTP